MPGQRLNWIKGPRYSMKKLDKASFKDTGNWGTTGAPPGIVTQYWHVVYYSISGILLLLLILKSKSSSLDSF